MCDAMFEGMAEESDEERTEENTISVLYNSCYGGWTPSDEALEVYNLRSRELNNTAADLKYLDGLPRHDPLLVQVFHELGSRFDGEYSKTKVEKIAKKYENYYSIHEYDGLEDVWVNKVRFGHEEKLKTVEAILRSSHCNDQKIEELNKMFL